MKFKSYISIFLLLITTHNISCAFWNQPLVFPKMKSKDIVSDEEIERILTQSNSKSSSFEESMAKVLPMFSTSKNEPEQNDCADRRDFSGPDFMQFLPQTKAILHNPSEILSFTNDCFVTNRAQIVSMNKEAGKVIVNIISSEPKSWTCKDTYVLTTSKHYEINVNFMKGDHMITMSGMDEDDWIDISVNGIRVFGFCMSLTETVQSVYKTYKFFFKNGAKIQKKMPYYKEKTDEEIEEEHVDFLHKFSNMTVEDRGIYGQMELPIEDHIQTGDMIGTAELDALTSTMLMYFTGGMVSHLAIALRLENNELYISEMQGNGLTLSTYKEFMAEQNRTRTYVVHLPLKKKYRKMFNKEAAMAYHNSLGKMKYGIYNVIFPMIDVPDKASAIYIPPENLYLMSFMIAKFDEKAVRLLLNEALNMRLGTQNLTLTQIAIEAAKQNITFENLVALPERDEWRYANGENVICSGYVGAMYRAAGLFKDLEINTKEIQPRDMYLLDIFDKDKGRPNICKEADPNLPYCQITGKYRLHLKGYASITPFSHMFEKCPCQPPFYELTPGC